MNTRVGRPAQFLPDADDTLILRAALLHGDEARDAWARLRPKVDLDHISLHWYRLVPLLFRNLLDLGVDDPDMPRFKGIYRNSWVRNQLLMRELARVLNALKGAGIDTLLLKGAALANTAYGDLGTRPMNDLDVLVPIARASQAIHVLEDAGWCRPPGTDRWMPFWLRYARESELHGPNHFVVDLHWLVTEELLRPGAWRESNDVFWAASKGTEIGGEPTRILCPADQLLHVCVHGPVWYSDAHVHWAADAVKLLEWAGPRLDWERLTGLAIERRAVLPVRDALGYLATALDATVPGEVLDRLDRVTVSRRVRRAYRVPPARDRWARWGRAGQVASHIDAYVTLSSAWSPWQAIAGAPAYFVRLGGVWLAKDRTAVPR